MNKLDWIKSQIIDGEPPASAASRLNTPVLVDNPTKQQKIPVPIDLQKIRQAVTDQEAFEVMETRTYDRILEAIQAGDRIAVDSHIKALLAAGKISKESVEKLIPILSETMPDPNWQPKVSMSPAQLAGFSLVLVNEVEQVIN